MLNKNAGASLPKNGIGETLTHGAAIANGIREKSERDTKHFLSSWSLKKGDASSLKLPPSLLQVLVLQTAKPANRVKTKLLRAEQRKSGNGNSSHITLESAYLQPCPCAGFSFFLVNDE